MPRHKKSEVKAKRSLKSSPDESDEMIAIDYNRLRTITSVIQLDTINLIDSMMTSFSDSRFLDAGQATLEYTVQLCDAAWARKDQQVDAVVGYQVTARVQDDDKPKEIFRVTARFLVGYRVPAGFTLDPSTSSDVMADLVIANGQINAFPYVRQLIADQTARAGWPPLQLDVFRAPAKRRRDFVREVSFGGQHTALVKQV